MKIGGLQKTTLLDFPGQVAAIVFTSGCNYRCKFCHNASLALGGGDLIGEDEIIKFLRSRKGVLDGISVSGGEPLMQKGLVPFLIKVRELGMKIKIDTNGTFPGVLKDLIDDGLVDYIAMDIKTALTKYPSVTDIPDSSVEAVKKSIEIIMNSGIDYEFRTTVVRELHEQNDIADIADMIKGARKYYLQSYKEADGVMTHGLSAYSEEEMNGLAAIAAPFVKEIFVR